MRKQLLFETPLGLWLRPEYFCMVSPVKHCCTPIHGLNDRSVEVCCAFTFFPWLLWQMGVSQVHSACLIFPYLSKTNMQLRFLLCYCCQAIQTFFSINMYSVSGPTTSVCGVVYVVGAWKQPPHCVWMVNLGVGAADPICVAAWASCQGRDACAWAFRRQKDGFVFRFSFSMHLSGTDWENPKLMHAEPSSFLALPA